MSRRQQADGFVKDVDGDQDRHERVEPGEIEEGDDDQGDEEREVGEDVHREVQGVRLEGRGLGAGSHLAQMTADEEGGAHADRHDGDADAGACHRDRHLQTQDRLIDDPQAGSGDHDRLQDGRQGLELAVAVGVAVVSRLLGMAERHEVDPRHEKIEQGVDGRGEDRETAGRDPGDHLEQRQAEGRGDGKPGRSQFDGGCFRHGQSATCSRGQPWRHAA